VLRVKARKISSCRRIKGSASAERLVACSNRAKTADANRALGCFSTRPLRTLWPIAVKTLSPQPKLTHGFLQDVLQSFVELPSNNIDSLVTKLSEGRNRPIVLECNFALGTLPKQDPNRRVKTS
jgi:hypothetical protein